MQDDINKAKDLINKCFDNFKTPRHSVYISRTERNTLDNLKEIVIILDKLPKRLEEEKQEWKEEYDEIQIKIQRMLKGPSWGMTKEEHQAIPLHKLFGDKWQGNKPDED